MGLRHARSGPQLAARSERGMDPLPRHPQALLWERACGRRMAGAAHSAALSARGAAASACRAGVASTSCSSQSRKAWILGCSALASGATK